MTSEHANHHATPQADQPHATPRTPPRAAQPAAQPHAAPRTSDPAAPASPPSLLLGAGQFAVGDSWRANLDQACRFIGEAHDRGVDLLALPEGILARFAPHERDRVAAEAQPLDGPFVSGLRAATAGRRLTVVAGVYETSGRGLPYNTLVVVRDGRLVAHYRKLHLYDAFGGGESARVLAADEVPAVFEVNGFGIGMLTCYDVRFPELSRLLAVRGAEVLVVPAAWADGPGKAAQWELAVRARALDNTAAVLASGECGPSCIGSSMIVDPLGRPLAGTGHEPGLITARVAQEQIDRARAALPVLRHRRFDVAATPRARDAAPEA